MKKLNLTEWSLNRRQLIYFLVFLTFVMGIFSYMNLARMEDPEFTIREMYITVAWPGATANQVEKQVTDVIERKLQDIPTKDYIRSYSMPGQAMIFISVKDSIPSEEIRDTWVEVRNIVNDIKPTLPPTIQGPFYNDRFDDVYGSIYALTADGYSYEEMRVEAEKIRRTFLGIKDVKKVDLLGVQTEKVYIQIENSKMAELGISANTISNTLQAQNTVIPSGMMETSKDKVYLRVSGLFENVETIGDVPITSGGKTFRLGDIAEITRGYSDPADPKMYYNGEPAIGIAVSMGKGGNILDLGNNLDETLLQIKNQLPLGLEIDQVANQPEAMKESINKFLETFLLAVIIVLIVSFGSLGVRTGTVVAIGIFVVIMGVFVGMFMMGIPLHKISLGALILSLGLLVDDEIIAIEMMSVRMEQGYDRFSATCYAYTSTAFPMLTGTLITCVGFIPIGLSKGPGAEYTGTIFYVVTIALLLSWIVSVCVTPIMGYSMIRIKHTDHGPGKRDIYDTKFYRYFRKLLTYCLDKKKMVIVVTTIAFVLSTLSMTFLLPDEFLPAATRPELIVDMTLPQGTSIAETEREAQKLAEHLEGDENIVNYSYYVGRGAPRFVLSLEPGMPATNYAQFIILTEDVKSRNKVIDKIQNLFYNGFESAKTQIKIIQNGMPSSYPVMLRVSGPEIDQVKEIASEVKSTVESNPNAYNVNYDWYEKSKAMSVEIDQNKVRELGLDSMQISAALQSQISGKPISQFRSDDRTIDIVLKDDTFSGSKLSDIRNLNIPLPSGKYVPFDQIAKVSYTAEDGLIGRRNLEPTITVQSEVVPGVTGNDVTNQVYKDLEEYRGNLPYGYSIEIGGALERSDKAIEEVMKVVPLMVIGYLVLLMIQLQNIPNMIMTLLTAPLGLIGVNLALLLSGDTLGFVAKLGVLALFGIIMRNSVILIDQIDKRVKMGGTVWDAIIDSAVMRFRPIMLTAVAAILGMIPLIPNSFWGPLAVAMSGGILVATALTLLVLPAMYAAWYKVDRTTLAKVEEVHQVMLEKKEENHEEN